MTSWLRWPDLRVLMLAALAPAVLIGLIVLARRSGAAVVVGVGLLAGTVLVSVGITLFITPGFAERTIIYATFGWATCAARPLSWPRSRAGHAPL